MESIKKLSQNGTGTGYPWYVKDGDVSPLIDKINELVGEVNRLNEVLDSNLIHKKDYSNVNPYDLGSRRKHLR